MIYNIFKYILKFLKFYSEALKNINQQYNLILEKIIYSPKYNQKVPLLRLTGSGGYLIETAANILKYDRFKCHLHPNDLIQIYKLYEELNNNSQILHEDLSGEIYFSDGDSINIYQAELDNQTLDRLFSLSKPEIARLLESRGFKKGREVSQEIANLKAELVKTNRSNLKVIN